jgi:hypothetical protein
MCVMSVPRLHYNAQRRTPRVQSHWCTSVYVKRANTAARARVAQTQGEFLAEADLTLPSPAGKSRHRALGPIHNH